MYVPRKEGEKQRETGRREGEISSANRSNLRRLWGACGCVHSYLGRVLLHGLEVEEGGVDQVIAMDDGDQLPFNVVALAKAQHLPQLLVLEHTNTHTYTNNLFLKGDDVTVLSILGLWL